ncbi:MAG: ferrous iron transport protein A [Anaerolineae bacterium]|nr:MAG: ferrous iron transport protein A [Anaerolineae bacterium]
MTLLLSSSVTELPLSSAGDVPLASLRVGQEGVVTVLAMRDEARLRKLMALGILPGARLRLVRRWPGYVFQIGFSQFAVDEDIAGAIYVRPLDASAAADL